MHDIDRTQLEMEWETGPYGDGEYESDGYEVGYSPELYGETYDEAYGEIYEEIGGDGPLGEADELEMAADLLEVMDEAELDQFLGSLFKKAAGLLPPAIRRPLGGILKGAAKKFLPVAGAALGNLVAPGVGGRIGSSLASQAGRLFGLELEGLSPEDQEFEIARQFVRTASEAARQAAAAPAGMSPQMVAQQAFTAAAQKHAPGLVRGAPSPTGRPAHPSANRGKARSGRWVRRGKTIILLGA